MTSHIHHNDNATLPFDGDFGGYNHGVDSVIRGESEQHRNDDENDKLTKLEKLCLGLRRQNILSCSIPDDVEGDEHENNTDDDTYAFLLAGSLMGNTSLYDLKITVMSGLTELGAKSLAKGIRHSAIQRLTISLGYAASTLPRNGKSSSSEIIQALYDNEMKHIQELNITCPLHDEDAVKLGAAFCNQRYPKLEMVSLDLTDVTERHAHALYKGIQTLSCLSALRIDTCSSGVCRILFSKGMIQLPTLRHVHLSEVEASDNDDDDNDDDDSITSQENVKRLKCSSGTILTHQKDDEKGSSPSHSQIETLHFSSCDLEDRVLMNLASTVIFGNTHLRAITVQQCEMGDAEVSLLVESLTKSNTTPYMEALNLRENEIGLAGLCNLLTACSKHLKIKTLNLSNNPEIGRADPEELMADERTNDDEHGDDVYPFQLDCLDLSSCELCAGHIDAIAKTFLYGSSIKTFNLTNSSIGDEGVSSLIDCLDHGMEVERLSLVDCNLRAAGIQALVKASLKRPYWKELDVLDNDRIGYRELAAIGKDLAVTSLSKFSFVAGPATTRSTKGAKGEREAPDHACYTLIHAVASNACLRELSLQYIDIPDAAKESIQLYLDQNKSVGAMCPSSCAASATAAYS